MLGFFGDRISGRWDSRLRAYTEPAEWAAIATCLTFRCASRSGTTSTKVSIRCESSTGVEPPKPGLWEVRVRDRQY